MCNRVFFRCSIFQALRAAIIRHLGTGIFFHSQNWLDKFTFIFTRLLILNKQHNEKMSPFQSKCLLVIWLSGYLVPLVAFSLNMPPFDVFIVIALARAYTSVVNISIFSYNLHLVNLSAWTLK